MPLNIVGRLGVLGRECTGSGYVGIVVGREGDGGVMIIEGGK
jgi:hypothetical protein